MKSKAISLALVILAAACSPPSTKGGGGGSGGNGGGAGGNGGGNGGSGGQDGGPQDRPPGWEGGPTCGMSTMPLPYTQKTPDVIIAFDKSGSMTKAFGTGSRYTTERDALVPLVTMYQDKIRWGFEEFPANTQSFTCPNGMSCCAAPVSVPPAFMNAAAVNKEINAGITGSRINTPTPDGLKQCAEFYAGFVDGITERFVLLSTDGEPNCLVAGATGDACTQSEDRVKALLAQGVKTIVLGVSEEVGASACLNRLAMAGGVPRAGGPPHFYPGSDPAALDMYLKEIISGLAKPSCTIDLNGTPPDPTRVAVFFDGVEVPWDPTHTNGWDYAPGSMTQIIIHGMYCTDLQGFKVSAIDIRFGCPPCGGTVACP